MRRLLTALALLALHCCCHGPTRCRAHRLAAGGRLCHRPHRDHGGPVPPLRRGHRHGDARRARRRRRGLRSRLGEASRAGPGARPSAAAAPRPTTSRPCTSASTKRRPSAAGLVAGCRATRSGWRRPTPSSAPRRRRLSCAGVPIRSRPARSPAGAQCLDDCGPEARARAIAHGATLLRGHGHARVGGTPAGVNGLHDMGAQRLGVGGRAAWRQRQRRAAHARRLVVVRPGADACRSPAVEAGRYRGGLHRLSLRAAGLM